MEFQMNRAGKPCSLLAQLLLCFLFTLSTIAAQQGASIDPVKAARPSPKHSIFRRKSRQPLGQAPLWPHVLCFTSDERGGCEPVGRERVIAQARERLMWAIFRKT